MGNVERLSVKAGALALGPQHVAKRSPSKPYGKHSGAPAAQDPTVPRSLPLSERPAVGPQGSYLVDPASSHMLVSKIKPCMSKYKLLYTVKLRMAH